ncbi:MAG: hypothetical protein A2381_10110 [Bdellovibrionales bacterium RIFOXYB1_FULL_37_110]|nr:MAG: hypothetical protein A2417_02625 [Bdellovibrionales bacterium RIFOXYC1_FULL_37_79]OFZ61119.1 MAG: hypothetical protein A2381_10110 [Bdellovibrionales bacterium RIFOXYB1_FULL_37_110]OFZ61602.1 MAG: hypothetical protein A2577_10470 [Bdellovibrionales bacterium RIFOXYD1_FULL_36_51]
MTATILSHKDFCLNKYKNETVPFLINRKLLIHKQLEKPQRTYCVYSDLHGSFEKYVYWLKNGLGYYSIAISEILGASYSKEIYQKFERLFLLVNRNRINSIQKHVEDPHSTDWDVTDYFDESVPKIYIDTIEELEAMGLSRRRILEDILKILRLITRGDEHRIIKVLPRTYLENILKLYFKEDRRSYISLVDGITENFSVFCVTTSFIIKLISLNVFDKHINLGDTFDRGNGSDKLIKLYKAYFGPATSASPLHYIWGNHDILWLGASVGNPVCCMTALRISMRYNNVDFLFRYGFNLDKLKNLSLNQYKIKPTGKYIKERNDDLWPEDVQIKMTKALLVLESKLTVSCLEEALTLKGHIDYRPYLTHYTNLLNYLVTDIPEDAHQWDEFMKNNPLYIDCFFPSVSKNNPSELTAEEQEVVEDIVRQFTTLFKLQDDIKWMFDKGETYRVMDNTVYYHAALPATENMDLEEVKGLKGKELLDFIQRDLKRIGEAHRDGTPLTHREKMQFWYLWCGSESPFFCKSKMATLERAIFNKLIAENDPVTTHHEEKNYYYKFIRNDIFLNKLLLEFHADKICMGHTPVKSANDGILSDNLRAFIVDGGASSAYGDRGTVLINTPDFTYVTFHPGIDELIAAEKENRLPDIKIETLEERKNLSLRNVDKGYFLRRELEALNELLEEKLDQWCDGYFV